MTSIYKTALYLYKRALVPRDSVIKAAEQENVSKSTITQDLDTAKKNRRRNGYGNLLIVYAMGGIPLKELQEKVKKLKFRPEVFDADLAELLKVHGRRLFTQKLFLGQIVPIDESEIRLIGQHSGIPNDEVEAQILKAKQRSSIDLADFFRRRDPETISQAVRVFNDALGIRINPGPGEAETKKT